MQHFNNKKKLFALLTEKATVITPNNRLSSTIIEQYFRDQSNKTVDKPTCLPYEVVLLKAYEQLNFTHPQLQAPTLLTSHQCQYLWRKLISTQANSTYSDGLLQAVMTAWEHCEQWQISPQDPTFCYTPQTRQFQRWWQLFHEYLQQNHLITECQLVPYLIQAHSPLFSQSVVWTCFNDFTPQQQQLQQHLQDLGLAQYQYDLMPKNNESKVFSAQNENEEYQQLINWLHLNIDAGSQHIGVVVPDLQQKSSLVERILTHHFTASVINSSLGQSLSQYPLVAHALCWLNLNLCTLTPHQAALLLQSPYLGSSQEEFTARSEYLQSSTLLEDQCISLTLFIKELKICAPQLATLIAQIAPYPEKATLHTWIDLFEARLNLLGFPGESGLNSANYQCLNRFLLLFDEFRQLSLFDTYLSSTDALETLQYLADNTIFQPQKTDALIHVCGLLEASGCEFDHLWVMGLTDQCLPQGVHLSAFIPPKLQRDHHMPHSLPARELEFAQKIIQRLHDGAGSIVFSYAELQGDSPNLPCSLITTYPKWEPLPEIHHPFQENELGSQEETYCVPLELEEPISGGTALLANQAKCPFKAFAEHRLGAQKLSQMNDGLDTRARGKIIHKVMELLWQQLQNQQALFAWDSDTLEHHIEAAIHASLEPLTQQHPETFSPLLQDIERARLKRLTFDCLEWEKQRVPFSIAALEQSFTINLAGLNFQVRVDRLDQVGDKKWVIDYKTSLPSNKPWNEDRPKEPQLLLYALLDNEINTLLLMQLKAGKISCSGLSEEKQEIHGISALKKEESWEARRDHWKNLLSDLAQEFQQGHCLPQPAQKNLCQQCSFANLCRFQISQHE